MYTLETRRAELEKEFNALNEELKKLTEQGKVLNQQVSKIQTRQLQLQGALKEAEYLLTENNKNS